MPLDYAIQTDVKPIIRDFKTGVVLDPGGAGDKYVVDRRGKRFPYEIVPDRTPSPVPKRTRIKSEPAAYDRLQTVDIKSEDEDKGANRVLTAQRRDGQRRVVDHPATPLRQRTLGSSARGREQSRQARGSSSDDDSSEGTESSSSKDDSTDEDDSSNDSSDDSSSSMLTDETIVEVSSVFRPSRSPSRFANTPSPTTRSRSRGNKQNRATNTPSKPSPLAKKKTTTLQVKSVQRLPSLSFYIPIRQTDCQSRTSDRFPSRPQAPERAESNVSPATSRGHGWNPINKKKSAFGPGSGGKKLDSNNVQPITTAPAAMLTSIRNSVPAARYNREATAGPSTGPHGPGPVQTPFIRSSWKGKESHVEQNTPQSKRSSTCRSPKGKEIATEPRKIIARGTNEEQLQSHHSQKHESQDSTRDKDKDSTKNQDDQESKLTSKKKKKWQKLKSKKKAKKMQQQIDLHQAKRHGPPRQARVERSIEDTQGPALPTPRPSSAIGNTPMRIQPAPISPSSRQIPPVSPNRTNPSPSTRHSKKRSRSVYENSDGAALNAVTKILEEMKAEERLGRERLEQKMDLESVEWQRFKQGWAEQLSRSRNEDRKAREQFALGLEGKIARNRQEDEDERERIKTTVAELETQLTTLQGQLQSQSEHFDLRSDGQASRLSSFQGQLDGQRARNSSFLTHLENNTRKLEALTKRLDEIDQREKVSQDATSASLQHIGAMPLPAGRANHSQGSAQARGFGAQRPHIREVPPREASDWSMRGRRPGVIANTLIRSDHGKPNPRTLPPLPHRNLAGGGSSSSRAAQTVAQSSNASPSGRPYEGALRQNRANISDHTVNYSPHAEYESQPLPTRRPRQDTAYSTQEPDVQSSPSPVQGAFIQPFPEIDPQPAPLSPEGANAAAIIESNPSLPGSPRLTHEEMKALVLNQPLSGLNLSIDYDKDTDGGQTTAATAFLLNAPQQLIANRFRAFVNRPAFAFDLDDPAVCAKGCWAVRADGQQDTQFKLYYNERNYAFTLSRLAVRMWHPEDSLLRLLLSKDHKAVHLCHNKRCFNPEHIVVESRKEHMDRLSCVKAGRCEGHRVWTKCGQIVERRRCIFS